MSTFKNVNFQKCQLSKMSTFKNGKKANFQNICHITP